MELDRIKILVNRYFDGMTTLEEERVIADYLASCETLPKELIPVRMMFETMGLLKAVEAPAVKQVKRHFRWSHFTAAVTVAASIVLAIIVTTNRDIYIEQPTPAIICHVDGVLVSDQAAAEHEARRILGNMNKNVMLAMENINKFNILKSE